MNNLISLVTEDEILSFLSASNASRVSNIVKPLGHPSRTQVLSKWSRLRVVGSTVSNRGRELVRGFLVTGSLGAASQGWKGGALGIKVTPKVFL